jgi:hypothetical protein
MNSLKDVNEIIFRIAFSPAVLIFECSASKSACGRFIPGGGGGGSHYSLPEFLVKIVVK